MTEPPFLPPPDGPQDSPSHPPPPPGRVAGLVAKSGFVQYEPGRSIFDQSVVVYLSGETSGTWPNTQITDHVGRHLGQIRRTSGPLLSGHYGDFSLYDANGSEVLRIDARTPAFRVEFRIELTANGRYVMATFGSELTIEVNGQAVASISARSGRTSVETVRTILSEGGRQIGAIKSYKAGGRFMDCRVDSVMWVNPSVDGNLRRLLLAAPLVIASAEKVRRNN